tara:strand:- start:17420 stop:18928 length:1509 start_codon:yes stop_codon:yes gene_type:complete
MASVKSPSGVKTKTYAYEDFQGLDTSRDVTSLDTGKSQHLSVVKNATCDWRGQIVRDPAAFHKDGDRTVDHVRFYSSDRFVYAERTGAGIDLKSDTGEIVENAFPLSSIISTTVFNRNVMFTSKSQQLRRFDGTNFYANASPAMDKLRPAYSTSTQSRMVVAGVSANETTVYVSRVNQDEIWPLDEPEDSNDVNKAFEFDVANYLGTADKITGLGSFEQNRLVVFAADRALIYRTDPDYTRWLLDDNANIFIGCASHNTIQNAGTDLLFCSRSGIHSIKRSEDNGILVYSYSLSDKVDLLYRELFNSVDDKEKISAVFDQDNGQYHVFFPLPGNTLCTRLTLALNPEGGEAIPKFSTGDFLRARCGAFLNGQLIYGTTGGVYQVIDVEIERDDAFTPEMEITTPLLWHGSLSETKETQSLILQAAGKGIIVIDAQDDNGKIIGSMVIEVDDTADDNHFADVPLSRQYERKWTHRYRAAQYRVKTTGGSGLLRIIGFAVNVRN